MILNLPNKWKFVIVTLSLAIICGLMTYLIYPRYVGLVFLFFYIIPSNSFIPFPHEPAIIYYGKIFGPFLTTASATLPTLIACIIDYAVLTPVFSKTRLAKIKNTGIYKKTVYYFYKAPFITNFTAAISPVPFYPVRILSVASGYPLWKYSSAIVLGRIPRYYFLAFSGALLKIPNWFIALFFVSLITVPLYQHISKKRHRVSPNEIEDSISITDLATEKEVLSAVIHS